MNLIKALNSIYVFIIKLKIQIKCLSDEKFNELLKDKNLDYTQRLLLCYLKYM